MLPFQEYVSPYREPPLPPLPVLVLCNQCGCHYFNVKGECPTHGVIPVPEKQHARQRR